MRWGLLAGSRGDLERLDKAMRLLIGPLRCERLLFLGEAYVDLDGLRAGPAEPARPAPKPIDSDADFLAAVTEFVTARSEQVDTAAAEEPDDDCSFEGVPVLRVPERGCPAYADPEVGAKHIDMIGTTLTLAVHHKGDLVKEDIANAVLIFHGASAEPALVQIGPRAFMTPGAISATPGTVAVFELESGAMHFEAHDLDGQELQRQALQLRRTTKFSLK